MARIPIRRRGDNGNGDAPGAGDGPDAADTPRTDAEWGVASRPPRGGPATHYQAARLPELGDVVVAVTRVLDPVSMAPERHQFRALLASAPDRARLLQLDGEELLAADGALGWVEVDLRGGQLSEPWPAPERRVARVTGLLVAGPTPAGRAVHASNGLADWLLTLVEAELAFATWLALEGDGTALERTPDGSMSPERTWRTGDFSTWGADWLEGRGYAVDRTQPGSFRRALNAPLLHRLQGELRA